MYEKRDHDTASRITGTRKQVWAILKSLICGETTEEGLFPYSRVLQYRSLS